jgi:hypothetical protein
MLKRGLLVLLVALNTLADVHTESNSQQHCQRAVDADHDERQTPPPTVSQKQPDGKDVMFSATVRLGRG